MRFSNVDYFKDTVRNCFPFLLFLSVFPGGNHFLSISLTEEEGRDLSCIVASLVQVMLDPYFRTITGFQSLIQKEWVMAGYQFLDRCNHLKRSEKEVRAPCSSPVPVRALSPAGAPRPSARVCLARRHLVQDRVDVFTRLL